VSFRIGIGYDLHRLAANRRLVLGSVQIPHERGLSGHSDADVVLHALCDAMLGAAALGDIGELFPDTDPAFKDADSRQFVREAQRRLASTGLVVANVDLIIHAQEPRLGPWKAAIQQSLADLLDLPATSVGVKATTNEGLDAVGRADAIACWAAVLVTPQA
jgi:2-C-methyl-D-erythritol 2,4-cyclodiphosphate synthase